MKREEVIDAICQDRLNDKFITLYGNNQETINAQKERYVKAIKSFETLYPESNEISIFSAPGRTEVCGNHTDHQHWRRLSIWMPSPLCPFITIM